MFATSFFILDERIDSEVSPMSAVSAPPLNRPPASKASPANPPRRWIVGFWVDPLLILLTPLLATPAVFMLYSSWVGLKAETISLIVTAFFATGHHLPGLIRAYGDRDLFERFRWRFLLAPPLVFLAYFPLFSYHHDLYRLIILVWATWHGLMQLYGFVRIYDAKVGSVAPATANWDWLVCVCGFVTPQLFRPERLSSFLSHWYSVGGPSISPSALEAARWTCLAISAAVGVGFAANYLVQSFRGSRSNPLKLLMLASGIGMWWYATICVENLLVGVALFEICHDVQYLAIVWLYNCRRVSSDPQLSGFMRYVFRRGMVLLYLGLITAYGALAFAGPLVLDGTVSQIFYGVLFTSTILHYYYDGFIWKVRETTNQAGLGLNQQATPSKRRMIPSGDFAHVVKWGAVVVGLAMLFASDMLAPTLTKARKDELERMFAQSLVGNSVLPRSKEEQSWLYSRFEQAQSIAAAVPNDRNAQLRAAILSANFGRNDEAIARLEKLLKQYPTFIDADTTLGGIHYYRGNLEQASASFRSALAHAGTKDERALVNLRWGEAYLRRNDHAAAEAKFEEALRDDPDLATSIDALRSGVSAPATSPQRR